MRDLPNKSLVDIRHGRHINGRIHTHPMVGRIRRARTIRMGKFLTYARRRQVAHMLRPHVARTLSP